MMKALRTSSAVARALREDKAELRRYVMMARAVLQAVAQFCHHSLQQVGVTSHQGAGWGSVLGWDKVACEILPGLSSSPPSVCSEHCQ